MHPWRTIVLLTFSSRKSARTTWGLSHKCAWDALTSFDFAAKLWRDWNSAEKNNATQHGSWWNFCKASGKLLPACTNHTAKRTTSPSKFHNSNFSATADQLELWLTIPSLFACLEVVVSMADFCLGKCLDPHLQANFKQWATNHLTTLKNM